MKNRRYSVFDFVPPCPNGGVPPLKFFMAKFPDIDAMQMAVVHRYVEFGFHCENSKQLTQLIGQVQKGEVNRPGFRGGSLI